MTYVITQSCCVDAACVPVCPVDCIHPTADEREFGKVEMLYIDPAACVDCGACAEACPVQAIVPDHELADENRHFADFAAAFYQESGRTPRRSVSLEAQEHRTDAGRVRVAIIGTGPSACYAALELLDAPGLRAEITMIDRLPAFGGLVRYGVAPDHQRTKGIADRSQRELTARVHFLFNLEVGRDISVSELHDHFHAVIYAVGASDGRTLDLAGENLPGVYSSNQFVGWYNGHPDHAKLVPDLSGGRALIVGNGNVALDIARILLADEAMLRASDIAPAASSLLAESQVEEVVLLGRRGPAQTAGTAPELSALARLPDVDVTVRASPEELIPAPTMSFSERLKLSLLADMAARPSHGRRKRLIFAYHHSPAAFEGDDRVKRVVLSRTNEGEEVQHSLDCGLVVTSIGYRGAAMDGLPFDERAGIMPSQAGRIVDADGVPLVGAYSTGWIKRGPSGVIGSNRNCAAETVAALVEDFRAGRLATPSCGQEAFNALAVARQPDSFGLGGWERIDRFERENAAHRSQLRRKLTTTAELLSVARSGT